MTRTLTRTDVTWAAYVLSALFTFLLGLIGPLMPHLRAELGLSYAQAALHTSAFAAGMMAAGFVGERVIAAIGRRATVWGGLAGLALGLTMTGLAPAAWVSIAGCAVMGLLGSLMAVVWPAVLAEAHGPARGVAFAEQGIVAYVGALAAPVVIWVVVEAGTWRNVALVGWTCLVLSLFAFRRVVFARPTMPADGGAGRLPTAYWAFWSLMAATVAAEFAVLVWATSFLEAERGLGRDTAVLAASIFPAGMLAGRMAGVLILRHVLEEELVLPSIGLAAFGFLLFWIVPYPVAAFAGLFLTGLGVANLYPVTLTLAMDSAGAATSAAAARTPLAAGLAIVGAPLVLGGLADLVGMRAAYAIMPAVLAAAVCCFVIGRRATPAQP